MQFKSARYRRSDDSFQLFRWRDNLNTRLSSELWNRLVGRLRWNCELSHLAPSDSWHGREGEQKATTERQALRQQPHSPSPRALCPPFRRLYRLDEQHPLFRHRQVNFLKGQQTHLAPADNRAQI